MAHKDPVAKKARCRERYAQLRALGATTQQAVEGMQSDGPFQRVRAELAGSAPAAPRLCEACGVSPPHSKHAACRFCWRCAVKRGAAHEPKRLGNRQATYDGASHYEIGDSLGVSHTSAQNLERSAMAKLRVCLMQPEDVERIENLTELTEIVRVCRKALADWRK